MPLLLAIGSKRIPGLSRSSRILALLLLTLLIPRKIFTPSQSTTLPVLESHPSDDIVIISSKAMTPIAVPNTVSRFLLGATRFSAVTWCIVATAAIVISILSSLILCHFLRKREKKLRGNDTVVDECDVGGSYKDKASEEVSSICKEEEKRDPVVIDVESQMTSSSGVIDLSTRTVCSFSALANILSPKEPSVSTTGSNKNLPNSLPSSSSLFCQSSSHELDSHSRKDQQSVERKDRPSSQFSSYQSSLSKFLESLRTFSSTVSTDSRSNSANQDMNKETYAYSSSVSHHSTNSVSVHGSKSGVREFESTSDHGQTLQIDNPMSLHQSSVETKDMPSTQSCVPDQRGDNAHLTLFDTDQGNCNSIRRTEKPNHSSSQSRLSSHTFTTNFDKSRGKNSESFSAHDQYSQRSRRIVNNPSFLQRYEEVKDMPSNKISSNASCQSSLGSLIRSLDTHPSFLSADQNGNSRNGHLRNEGSNLTTSQADKNNNILSSHGSLAEFQNLSTQGSYYKSEQTVCNPSSITVSQEEARDRTSSQFSSYASYQSIFSGFVRRVDAISSLFRSQQKNSVMSQEMDNGVRSSSASRCQHSSVSKMRCDDFPTHKFPSGIESLSSLHMSSITAVEPLCSKDHSQLSSQDTENLMDSNPVISGLSKIDSSTTASSKNSFTKSDMKRTSSKDNPQGSIQVTARSGLCSHDSSSAAKTSKKKIDTPSSSCHSERPLQSIKSQVNSNNSEFLQTSFCKQNSLSVTSECAKRTTLSSMSSGTCSSRSDFSSTSNEKSKVHTKSNFSTFLRDLRPRMTSNGVEISQDSECSRASSVLYGKTNRVSYSPKSCSTRSNSSSSSGSFDMSRDLSNYSMAEVTESSVSDTSAENLVPYGCVSFLPNSSTDDSYTNAYRKSMSSSTNDQPQSPVSAMKYSTSRIPLILSENYSRDDSFAAAYIKSMSVSSNDYSPGPPCVLKIPDASVARSHGSSAIASYKKSTSRLSEFESKVTGDGVEVMKYSTSFAPLIFSGNYSRDDGSSSSTYTKSMSVSSNNYSLPPPCGLKNPDTSVERNYCSSVISSYNNIGSREVFDQLSGFESHVTGDGVEVIEKSEGVSSSTFASHHAISHSTCSEKCSGLPSQASEGSAIRSNPSRTARKSENSHSSGIEVSASWLRGSETSSNFSQDESINSSYNSTICKSESQLSGNSSTGTSDLQSDSGRMGLCFFSSNVPYSTSTASHDTDAETC